MKKNEALQFTKKVENQNKLIAKLIASNNELDKIVENANGFSMYSNEYHVFNTEQLFELAKALEIKICDDVERRLYFHYNGIKYFNITD